MGSHDSVHGTDQLAADEHDRNRRRVFEQPHESHLDLFPSRVLVQLIHGRVHSHSAEEPLHSVAHAAAAQAEYHHRALRRQPRHSLQRVRHVHAPRRTVVAPGLGLVMLCLVLHSCFSTQKLTKPEEEEETLFETRVIDERKHVWAGFL